MKKQTRNMVKWSRSTETRNMIKWSMDPGAGRNPAV
jgi:hypothetical protein